MPRFVQILSDLAIIPQSFEYFITIATTQSFNPNWHEERYFLYSLSFLDQILSSDLYQKNFLFLKKVKKLASKVDHNRPRPFFPQSSPDQSPQPRIDFPYYEISEPDICSLICEVALKISIYLAFIIHAHEG